MIKRWPISLFDCALLPKVDLEEEYRVRRVGTGERVRVRVRVREERFPL